jgi:outer membrane protein assembly factor BamD (BamD/ComL family)
MSFLLLGDLNYTRKSYAFSYAFYDSIQVPLLKPVDQVRVKERTPALKIISENQTTLVLQDSLQKLAAMPLDQRNALVRKVLRQLRKEKGLKELAANDPGYGNNTTSNNAGLFGGPGAPIGSDFYFLNSNLRAKGFNDFKTQWGDRPNVDNWQRQSAVDRTMNIATALKEQKQGGAQSPDDKELSFDGLYKNIPLTSIQKDSSNAAIIRSLLGNGLTFQNKLEDYPSAIEAYEELLRRFPESGEVEQVLFNLSYCYRKNNQPSKAFETADLLRKSFAGGKYAKQLAQGNAEKKKSPAEEQYESIYRMFIEGRFAEAKEAKLRADKQFGKNYWTPQLLYIESIYYVKKREDSSAINRLQSITSLFPKSPLAERAQTMIDVLKNRWQIEWYLANLKVVRKEDDIKRGVDLDSTNPVTGIKVRRFTPFTPPAELSLSNRELVNLSNTNTIAIEAPVLPKKDSGLVMPKTTVNPLALENGIKIETQHSAGNSYSFNPTDTQYVVVILDKVDPIFITEGRNAFNRFNQERFPGQRINMSIQKINDQTQLLLFGPFANASEAVTYIDRTRPLASTRIVPWLTVDKYSFSIISSANMQALLKTQDLAGYKAFMHQVFPDKF